MPEQNGSADDSADDSDDGSADDSGNIAFQMKNMIHLCQENFYIIKIALRGSKNSI